MQGMQETKGMIGIVAPSNKLPSVEFRLGLRKLRSAGLKVEVHPQCRRHDFLFAGTDSERAGAFYEYATDPRFSVLWCARGGYGAVRILPLLDRLTEDNGIPGRKLLVGYSDATALLEYVRSRWGWATLHGPMPAMRRFCLQTADEWESLRDFLRGARRSGVKAPWEKARMRFIGKRPRGSIEGRVVGGNLTVWTSLLGTPFAASPRSKILFFEDVDEGIYRLDRMIQQLRLSNGLAGARAIFLGNFLGCNDTVAKVLRRMPGSDAERDLLLDSPRPEDLRPLRKKFESKQAIQRIFGELGEALGIPVACGLPVGHGPGIASLPLGARYRLDRQGKLELLEWDWLGDRGLYTQDHFG